MSATARPSGQSSPQRTVVISVIVTLLVVGVLAVFATIGYRSGRRGAVADMPRGSSGMATVRASLPAAARAALDSGNVAYRAKAFPEALAQYRAAAAAAPNEAAPYFGILMAATALKETAVADSASATIRALTQTGGQLLSDSSLQQLHTGPPKHPVLHGSRA